MVRLFRQASYDIDRRISEPWLGSYVSPAPTTQTPPRQNTGASL